MQSPLQLLLDLFDEPKATPVARPPVPRPPASEEDLHPVPGEPLDRVLTPQAFRHPDASVQ